jgi:hypothetical protein
VKPDDEVHSAQLAIYSRLDVIDGKITVLGRANGPQLLSQIEEFVKANPIVGQIYLALDGRKNQDAIVAELESSKPAVSRWLGRMAREYGLVDVVKGQGAGKIYRRDPEMEELLHLTGKIEKWLTELERAKRRTRRKAR